MIISLYYIIILSQHIIIFRDNLSIIVFAPIQLRINDLELLRTVPSTEFQRASFPCSKKHIIFKNSLFFWRGTQRPAHAGIESGRRRHRDRPMPAQRPADAGIETGRCRHRDRPTPAQRPADGFIIPNTFIILIKWLYYT